MEERIEIDEKVAMKLAKSYREVKVAANSLCDLTVMCAVETLGKSFKGVTFDNKIHYFILPGKVITAYNRLKFEAPYALEENTGFDALKWLLDDMINIIKEA